MTAPQPLQADEAAPKTTGYGNQKSKQCFPTASATKPYEGKVIYSNPQLRIAGLGVRISAPLVPYQLEEKSRTQSRSFLASLKIETEWNRHAFRRFLW